MMGFGVGGFMGMTVFWLLAGGLVIFFAQQLVMGRREGLARGADARDVLEARFASGELSKQDFEDMRRSLDEI